MGVDIFGATGNEIVMDHVLSEPRRLADLLSVTEAPWRPRRTGSSRNRLDFRSVAVPASADVGYADGRNPQGHAALVGVVLSVGAATVPQ